MIPTKYLSKFFIYLFNVQYVIIREARRCLLKRINLIFQGHPKQILRLNYVLSFRARKEEEFKTSPFLQHAQWLQYNSFSLNNGNSTVFPCKPLKSIQFFCQILSKKRFIEGGDVTLVISNAKGGSSPYLSLT